ncbi:uncharacterized protein V1510DRAFT_412378 [Dipodascopsis tothii]|uniref:uncharacterized protein n=1 Tax=Dipodascopsis tothii TaxID=44089 RepID=UPI0034CE93A6
MSPASRTASPRRGRPGPRPKRDLFELESSGDEAAGGADGPAGANDGDDGGADEASEFPVEAIVGHDFGDDGKIYYCVKWLNYDEKDNTWEEEENLSGAMEVLEEYFSKIGGRPTAKDGGKRRKRSSVTPKMPPKKRAKAESGRKKSTQTNNLLSAAKTDAAPKSESTDPESPASAPSTAPAVAPEDPPLPRGVWEDKIKNITSIEQLPDGALMFYIDWVDGHKSVVASDLLYARAPMRALHFYESHIQFTAGDE